jgi:hypothetical protein
MIENNIPSIIEDPRCPSCHEKTDVGSCPTHGTICETCGTIYDNQSCSNCYSPISKQLEERRSLEKSGAQLNLKTLRLGSLGIGAKEFATITGRQSVTRKESNILRAANDEDHSTKTIRQKSEAAVRWLNLPRKKEAELVEAVERNAIALRNLYRQDLLSAGQRIHTSPEKLVEYSILTEAKKIGKSIREVQDALAKSGFNIKLQTFRIRIVTPFGNDITAVRMSINGWMGDQKSFQPKEAGEGPLGKEYTVLVRVLLSDTIDLNGIVGGRNWIKVHFENASILPDESVAITQKGKYKNYRGKSYPVRRASEYTKREIKNQFLQKDSQTVLLKLNGEKCFALFKDKNYMEGRNVRVKSDQLDKLRDQQSAEIDGSIRQHLSLPSKKFPGSAGLMQRACCLAKAERRATELFRESLKNSDGRSQRTLARDALIKADQEVFASLPLSIRLIMNAYTTTLPLKRKDRNYTGVKGLLILSEVLQS